MTLSDDTFQIGTPENVDFGYEIAGIGSRFLAALLDTLLITLLQAAAMLAVFFGLALLDVWANLDDDAALGWMLAIYALIAFGFLWGYYIFFETLWDGQTPGKRKARLRVIRSDGLPIGFAEAAIRNLVRLVDFLPAYYGVGVAAMFIDGRSRRLGDLAAGTLVVRDRGTITLESLEKERAALLAGSPAMAAVEAAVDLPEADPAGIPAGEAEWPVKRLTPQDLRLAEDFLRRRGELANRDQLGRQIAHRLQERMGLSPEALNGLEAEAFLLQALRLRQEN